MNNKNVNIAIVVSHPIQHFCPQYISLSKLPNVNVKVFFASMLGYRRYFDKNFGSEIVWNNLRIDEFKHVFMNGEQVLPSNKDLEAPTLESELEAFHPDAIITYGYFQKFQRACHKWANIRSIPLVYITDAENRQNRHWAKKISKVFALRWYFKKINYFFTVGNANEDYYKLYGVNPKSFIRMHYPIDIEVYSKSFGEKEFHRKAIREKFGIPENMFVINVVGKLVEWKNQSHLIDLLKNLESKGVKAHVIILGTGSTLEELKIQAAKLKSNVVHFAGFVDPLDLPKYYAASDLYLHPAKIEPHSLAISEAIFMGMPIVLSDRCGSYGENDDVQVGKNGFVYKFGDIEEMSVKVIKLIEDRELLNNFSNYSVKISRDFQKRSHGECVIDLIDRIKKN
ncbi:MAG: glycosyltransferase involved in cell wall biosynthesis [Flavobacteriales bacterium]|jgi:glycosyltransferase involved in cell wall biosynthesis